jgi:hypothetical protein
MSHWIFSKLPLVIPVTWVVEADAVDGRRYFNRSTAHSLIVSGGTELDRRRWIHLSLAHPRRTPTWNELVGAKEFILGRDTYAYQVIPPRARYVDMHPHCLHLFHCIDCDPLPDFTRGSGSL